MTALTRWLLTAAACIAVTGSRLAAAPVPAGSDPVTSALALVPAQAPIVVHVRGVERTKDRLAAFLKAAVPDFGPIAVAQIEGMLNSGFEGRKLAGLEKDGPIFLAVLEMPIAGGPEPPYAVVAAVSGYKAFRDGLLNDDERKNIKAEDGYERAELNGRETFFIDQHGFAAVTSSKDAAVLLSKKPAGLDGKLSADIAKRFLANDLSLYVNLAAVNKQYGDQIKGARESLEAAMTMAAGGADKTSAEYMKVFFAGMFQAIEDGRVLLAALDFRPGGMNLHFQFQVGADSKTNQSLRDQKPDTLTGIGSLPSGLMLYSAAHMSGDLLKTMAPLIYGTLGGEGDAKTKIEAAIKQIIAAGNKASFSGTNMPPAGVQVQSFGDPAKAVAATLSLFRDRRRRHVPRDAHQGKAGNQGKCR